MPKFQEFTYPSSDGRTMIYTREFIPDGDVRGVVQIAHGVAEYAERYDAFMTFLAENGFVAAANDHLGHGRSICTEEDKLMFAEFEGWEKVTEDMRTLHLRLTNRYPNAKCVLFGHSMGSFITRTYLIRHPDDFDAGIICGTGFQSSAATTAGRTIAKFEISRHGKAYRSELLNNLAFGGYNRKFESHRTEYDWLSRNEENVDHYIEDPLCGGITSASLFYDMLGGIAFVCNSGSLDNMCKSMPVLFVSGAMDPVGDYGKGVAKAYNAFLNAGMEDVSIKLYKDDRHEILNEIDRETVFADILGWIGSKI